MNIYFRFRGTPYRVKREEKGNNSTESLVNTWIIAHVRNSTCCRTLPQDDYAVPHEVSINLNKDVP